MMDVEMPVMIGLIARQGVRKIGADAPIISMSAKPVETERLFLPKPFGRASGWPHEHQVLTICCKTTTRCYINSMRSFWCIATIISVLFMSADGAADLGIQGHPHGDGAAQHVSDPDAQEPDESTKPTAKDDHCERCCHGHSSTILTPTVSFSIAASGSESRTAGSPHIHNFASAPPTPPPTT